MAVRSALLLAAAVAIGGASYGGNDGQDFSQIERGRYLTVAGDCAACHTGEDGRPFAGGRPIETPFGNVLATNITPDAETGIGAWTDDQFVRALTRGIRRDGAHLYPAMPYPYFAKVTRVDALAIRAYLATVAPVRKSVQADQLPFPFSIRAGMVAWNKLYFDKAAFKPAPGKSAEWNRGAYLVEGLMHCGACHTPKNFAGGDKTSERLQGGVVQGWFAPDLTPEPRRGIGGWSVEDIAVYLRTGHNRFSAAAGPMADEIERSSSRMTDADLHAVATYLKDQPRAQKNSAKPPAAPEMAMQRGAAIYRDECSACHTPSGSGIRELFPALAGSPLVQSQDPTSLIRVLIAGTRTAATDIAPTGPAMPPFGWILDDDDAAAVLTFVRNNWGNAAPAVTADAVEELRRRLAKGNE